MTLNIEFLLKFIKNNVKKFEKETYNCIYEIKKESDINKIEIIIFYLSSIYLSFNIELKEVLNQRIGKKDKLFQMLKDFDRIDDIENRKILIKK